MLQKIPVCNSNKPRHMQSGIVTGATLVACSLSPHTPFESRDHINNKSSKIPAVTPFYTQAGHLSQLRLAINIGKISAGLINPALDLGGIASGRS